MVIARELDYCNEATVACCGGEFVINVFETYLIHLFIN